MTKSEMIEKALELARKGMTAGTGFDPAEIAAVINAGEIPEGATIASVGAQTLRYEGGEVVCYHDERGAGKRTPAAVGTDAYESVLIQYAVRKSQRGSRGGC
jgi:hypothetical protein